MSFGNQSSLQFYAVNVRHPYVCQRARDFAHPPGIEKVRGRSIRCGHVTKRPHKSACRVAYCRIVIDDGAYFKGSIDIVKSPPIVRKPEPAKVEQAKAEPAKVETSRVAQASA